MRLHVTISRFFLKHKIICYCADQSRPIQVELTFSNDIIVIWMTLIQTDRWIYDDSQNSYVKCLNACCTSLTSTLYSCLSITKFDFQLLNITVDIYKIWFSPNLQHLFCKYTITVKCQIIYPVNSWVPSTEITTVVIQTNYTTNGYKLNLHFIY